MPEVVRPAKLVFVVPTTDLAASIRFYRDGLGLELTEEWDDMGGGAILRGSSASEVESIEVEEVADPPEPRTALGLQVGTEDVDAIYGRLEAAGARVLSEGVHTGSIPTERTRLLTVRFPLRRARSSAAASVDNEVSSPT